MIIKFVATRKMPTWKGRGEIWRDGDTRELEDANAVRMLGLYESPFVEVKDVKPESDKMVHGVSETKMPIEDKGKGGEPAGDNLLKKFKPKGFTKRKGRGK